MINDIFEVLKSRYFNMIYNCNGNVAYLDEHYNSDQSDTDVLISIILNIAAFIMIMNLGSGTAVCLITKYVFLFSVIRFFIKILYLPKSAKVMLHSAITDILLYCGVTIPMFVISFVIW